MSKFESQRIAALTESGLLDTEPEKEFDDIARLASIICDTPISLVSLVDSNRQWFKSRVGLEATETPRDISFCTLAIQSPHELFVVEDALLDERFVNNPLVTEDPKIRFYAGAPLLDDDNQALGTLCVIDQSPRALSESQTNALAALSRQLSSLIALRKARLKLTELVEYKDKLAGALREDYLKFSDLVEHATDIIQSVDADGKFVYVNHAWLETLGYTLEESRNMNLFDVIASESMAKCQHDFEQVLQGHSLPNFSVTFKSKDGEEVRCEGSVSPRMESGKMISTRGIFRILNQQDLESSKMIKVCAWCKHIEDTAQSWVSVEKYLSEATGRTCTHGICSDCFDNVMDRRPQ